MVEGVCVNIIKMLITEHSNSKHNLLLGSQCKKQRKKKHLLGRKTTAPNQRHGTCLVLAGMVVECYLAPEFIVRQGQEPVQVIGYEGGAFQVLLH